MSARALALVLLSLVCCKKQEDPAAAAASTPPDRRARCERIGEQMTQMGLLVARGLVSGLSEGKQQLEEDAELKAGLDTARAELVEDCMSWSDETLDCFGITGVLESEKCERLLAEALGEAVPPPAAPPGPPPSWSFTLPEHLSLLHGCDDGTALAVIERDQETSSLVAIAEGKQRWARPLPAHPWSIEPLDDAHALVVMPRGLIAIAIADGSERWRAVVPEGDDEPSMIALLREGDRLTVLDEGRRVLRVDLPRCAKGPCIETLGTLATDDPESHIKLDLNLHEPFELARLPGGALVVTATEQHRSVVLDEQLHLRFAIESRAAMSWVRSRADALVLALDGEVVRLDPNACGSAGKTYAPSTWPPAGHPDWLREITVREGQWAETPPGCVVWRRPLAIAELADAPVDGFDDAMILQAGGFLFAIDRESERWKSSVAAESLAIRHGDAIAVLGDVGRDETELALMWLSPQDGTHVAHSRLALGKGEYFALDGPQLVAAGELAIAGYDRELVAFGR